MLLTAIQTNICVLVFKYVLQVKKCQGCQSKRLCIHSISVQLKKIKKCSNVSSQHVPLQRNLCEHIRLHCLELQMKILSQLPAQSSRGGILINKQILFISPSFSHVSRVHIQGVLVTLAQLGKVFSWNMATPHVLMAMLMVMTPTKFRMNPALAWNNQTNNAT